MRSPARLSEPAVVLYGVNPVRELLRARPGEVRRVVLAAGDRSPRLTGLADLAVVCRVPVEQAGPAELDRLARGGNHQGACAEAAPFAYADIDETLTGLDGRPVVLALVLDGVTDEGNAGNILRTAACAGVGLVVLPERRSFSVSPFVERASSGASRALPVCRVVNLARALERLKEAGFWIYGADPAGPAVWDLALAPRAALVLGAEDTGLHALIRSRCDLLASLPVAWAGGSLNVAAAAGPLLYEHLRQHPIR